MARYEDTSTAFGEAQFAGVRERKQEEAAKQDKIAKRLLKIDSVVKGANYLINRRADELEVNQTPRKTHYQTLIKKSEDLLATQKLIQDSGRTTVNYLEDQYYQTLIQDAEQSYSHYNLGASTVNGGTPVYEFLRGKANKMAVTAAGLFDTAIGQAQNLGSLGNFDTDWEKISKIQNPRSIFDFGTNLTKKIFSKETPETVAFKEGVARDLLYNKPIVKQFENFETSLKAYHDIGYDVGTVVNEINSKAKELRKKITSVGTIQTSRIDITLDEKTGEKKSVTTTVMPITYAEDTVEIREVGKSTEILFRDELPDTAVANFYATVPQKYQKDFNQFFTGTPTLSDLTAAIAFQTTQVAYNVSPIEDINGALDTVDKTSQMMIRNAGYLGKRLLDKYKNHPDFPKEGEYTLNEKMYEEDPDDVNNKVNIKGKYAFIAELEGWTGSALIGNIFAETSTITASSGDVGPIGDTGEIATGAFGTGVIQTSAIKEAYKKRAQVEKLKDHKKYTIAASTKILDLDPTEEEELGFAHTVISQRTTAGNKGIINISDIMKTNDLHDLLGDGYVGKKGGTGTVLFDLDNRNFYIKQDAVGAAGGILSNIAGTDDKNTAVDMSTYTEDIGGRTALKLTETKNILEQLDVSSYSTNQLATLHDLNFYDILDKIGLDNISKGGVQSSSPVKSIAGGIQNIARLFIKDYNIKSYNFKNLNNVQKATKNKVATSSSSTLDPFQGVVREELPDSFYNDLKELFGTN